LKAIPQFLEVVYLSIEDDSDGAIFGVDRLAAFSEVDDR
jgi:hypothetical protein